MGDAAKAIESSTLVVTLTQEQLKALMVAAVREATGNANGAAGSDYMTVEQVGEWLQADPRTVRQWIKTEGLPAMRIGTREWRLSRKAVLAWMEARTSKPGGHSSKHEARLKRATAGG